MMDQTIRSALAPSTPDGSSATQKLKPVINAQVPFAVDDLFFSRTDKKGLILFGNAVFQQISQYSWSELSRKPHNIIRHPDMPRAVFWLLWQTIAKGEPIGAYVKNRAKDGHYYWVFAVVTPIRGGYLSVRIKPTGPLLPIIEQEYATLLAVEKTQNKSPAQSAQMLLERLSELGFRDYTAFMASALAQEVKARNDTLGRQSASVGLVELLKEASLLLEQAESIVTDHAAHRYVPVNLRVHAAKLGEAGVTIGVIAMNYDRLATEFKTMVVDFMAAAKRLFSAVGKALFLVATAELQEEASELLRVQSDTDAAVPSHEIELLDEQSLSYEDYASKALASMISVAEHFEQSCQELKNLAAALGTTRIMGKVEVARLEREEGGGLNDLLDDLQVYQREMTDGIQSMLVIGRSIKHSASLCHQKWD